MNGLTPGQWYLRFTCERCEAKQVLFADLSRGEVKIKATYVVECTNCLHKGAYDGDRIERYQHPADEKALSVAAHASLDNQAQTHDEVNDGDDF